MAYLILVRHGKSEWNKLGLWTGWTDVDSAPEGVKEAESAGKALADIPVHRAHVSALKRARQTFNHIHQEIESNLDDHEVATSPALNERHYGVHTGKNKWQVRDEVGEEEFSKIRRGWDHPVPEGETLKDVHGRVSMYFEESIKPQLRDGHNVLIVAHGNSLRALIKHIEELSDEAIADVELGTAEAHCYAFDERGVCVAKEIRAANPNKV
ncbi:MAG: 2,3-bisphosphoglycerate-dependent phosphoglycerate mutase [Patescibacteria group bacterium]